MSFTHEREALIEAELIRVSFVLYLTSAMVLTAIRSSVRRT